MPRGSARAEPPRGAADERRDAAADAAADGPARRVKALAPSVCVAFEV